MNHSIRFSLLFLLASLFCSTYAQDCADCRYISQVFDSVEVSTVKFGEGENADGNMQELFMDIYQPYGDTMSQRAVFIFAFGGGFIQGSREEGYVKMTCERFARTGYVTAAIDYRIGFDPIGVLFGPNEELMRTFFRAMQDMRGAIQWFRAHADVMNNTLRIDPDRIISGGASAGGIAACMVAYCDKETEFAEIGNLSAIAGLGGFEASSGLYPAYSWESAGIFNIAGGIVNSEWLEPGDPPIFCSHGDEDITVPYEGGNFGIGPISVGLEGSYNIDQAAQAAGICSYLHTMVGEDHPSGGESAEYFEEIFVRALPTSKATIQDRDFCCGHSLALTEDQPGNAPPATPIRLTAAVTNGNAPTLQWCEVTCGQSQAGGAEYWTAADPSQARYILATATQGNCVAFDYMMLGPDPVGRPEVAGLGSIQLFPNPVTNTLHLDFRQHPGAWVQVISAAGQVVLEAKIVGHGIRDLSVADLTPGLYILRVEGEGAQRFIKQ